jgi:hypothetical protein
VAIGVWSPVTPRDPVLPWHGEPASTEPRRLLVQAVEKSLVSPTSPSWTTEVQFIGAPVSRLIGDHA